MGVLPAFTGIAVHDGWKPYKTYTGAVHALCNAHHLRELAGVVEGALHHAPRQWAAEMADLLVEIWDAIKDAHAEHAWVDGFSVDEPERYLHRYEQVIAAGRALHPPQPPGSRSKRSKAANLLDHLMPARRLRVSPRAVKRPLSRYAYKSLLIDRRTYKATISIDILTGPISP
jgi:transposase